MPKVVCLLSKLTNPGVARKYQIMHSWASNPIPFYCHDLFMLVLLLVLLDTLSFLVHPALWLGLS